MSDPVDPAPDPALVSRIEADILRLDADSLNLRREAQLAQEARYKLLSILETVLPLAVAGAGALVPGLGLPGTVALVVGKALGLAASRTPDLIQHLHDALAPDVTPGATPEVSA